MDMLLVLRIGCLVLPLQLPHYSQVSAAYFTTPSYYQHDSNFANYGNHDKLRPAAQYVPPIPRQRLIDGNPNLIYFDRTTPYLSTVPYTNIYNKWTTRSGQLLKGNTQTESFTIIGKSSENTTTFWLPGPDIKVSRNEILATRSMNDQKLNETRPRKELFEISSTNEMLIDEHTQTIPGDSKSPNEEKNETTSSYKEQLNESRKRMKNVSTNADIVEDDFTSLPEDLEVSQNENVTTTLGYKDFINIRRRSMNNLSATASTDNLTIDDDDDCMKKVIGLLMKNNDKRGWEQVTHSVDPIFRRSNNVSEVSLDNDDKSHSNEEHSLNSGECVNLRRSEEDTSNSNPGDVKSERLQCYSCSNNSNVNCENADLYFTPKKYCDQHEVCLTVVTKNIFSCRTSLHRSCARSDACTNRHTSPMAERVSCVTCPDALCNGGLETISSMPSYAAFLVAVFVVLADG